MAHAGLTTVHSRSNLHLKNQIAILLLIAFSEAAPLLHAGELFPLAPSASSQQRIIEQPVRGRLTTEDREKIANLAVQAKKLTPEDQKKLKTTVQKSISDAAAQGNLNQVKFLSELLQQMD